MNISLIVFLTYTYGASLETFEYNEPTQLLNMNLNVSHF